MHYRTLGRSGIKVSLLGFGTGGPTTFTEAGSPTRTRRASCTAAWIAAST